MNEIDGSIIKREYPDSPVVGVGAVIIKDGKVLIVKRGKEPGYGRWSIPGGAVHLGEKLAPAVEREVLEETGLVVESGEVVEVYEPLIRDEKGRVRYHYVLIDFHNLELAEESLTRHRAIKSRAEAGSSDIAS